MDFDELKTLYIDKWITCILSTTDLNSLSRAVLDAYVLVQDTEYPLFPTVYTNSSNTTEQMLNHQYPNMFELVLFELIHRFPVPEEHINFTSYIENAGSTPQPADWVTESFVCPSLQMQSSGLRLVEQCMQQCVSEKPEADKVFPCVYREEQSGRSPPSYLKVSFLLSLLINSVSLPHLAYIVTFLEQQVQRGVLQMQLHDRQIAYSLLRCLNTIPKRLSSTQHYSLLGRILMYTSFAFPIAEKAQANLGRMNNDDALTFTTNASEDPFCAHLQGFHNAQLNTDALFSNSEIYNSFQSSLQGILTVQKSHPRVASRRPEYYTGFSIGPRNRKPGHLERDAKNKFQKRIQDPKLLAVQLEDQQTTVTFYYHLIFVVFSLLMQLAFLKDDLMPHQVSVMIPGLRASLHDLFQGLAESSTDGPAECAFLVKYMLDKEVTWFLWKQSNCEDIVLSSEPYVVQDTMLGFNIPTSAEYAKFAKDVKHVQYELNGNEDAFGVTLVVEQGDKVVCPLLPMGSASLMLLTETYSGGAVCHQFDNMEELTRDIQLAKKIYRPIEFTDFDEEPVEILKRQRRSIPVLPEHIDTNLFAFKQEDYVFPTHLQRSINTNK